MGNVNFILHHKGSVWICCGKPLTNDMLRFSLSHNTCFMLNEFSMIWTCCIAYLSTENLAFGVNLVNIFDYFRQATLGCTWMSKDKHSVISCNFDTNIAGLDSCVAALWIKFFNIIPKHIYFTYTLCYLNCSVNTIWDSHNVLSWSWNRWFF